jgi:hypothetical protein
VSDEELVKFVAERTRTAPPPVKQEPCAPEYAFSFDCFTVSLITRTRPATISFARHKNVKSTSVHLGILDGKFELVWIFRESPKSLVRFRPIVIASASY